MLMIFYKCIPSVKFSFSQPYWKEPVEAQFDLNAVVPHLLPSVTFQAIYPAIWRQIPMH